MITSAAYLVIVNEYSDHIYHYLCKHLKDKNMAQDLTQDCFMKLWSHRFFVKEASVKSWLFKTAYRAMLNYIRKNKRLELENNDFQFSETNNLEKLSAQDLVDVVFDALTLNEKTLLLLKDKEGYSYEEIADITSISVSNVKSQLFRARQKFKNLVQKINTQEKSIKHG